MKAPRRHPEDNRAIARFRLRDHPAFRRLWMAQVVSQLGDWLGRMAVLELIQTLSGPSIAVGLGLLYAIEYAVRLLPSAVFSPLAGSVADRLPRRLVMVAADVIRALIVLGLLAVREPAQVPLLYALLVAQTAVGIFFEAARSAAVPSVVPPELLQDAHALSAATWSTLLAVGSLAGGAVVALAGTSATFAIDAATYLASAALLVGLRLPAISRHAERFRLGDLLLLRDVRRGWRHASDLGVVPAVLAKCFWGAAGGYIVLLPIAAARRAALDAGTAAGKAAAGNAVARFAGVALLTGLLYAARGLGTGVGPIVAKRILGRDERGLRLQVMAGFLLGGGGYVAFTAAPNLAVELLCVFTAHLGGSTLWVASTVLWQRRVSDEFQGRVFAIEFLALDIAFAAGGLAGGLAYDRLGSLDEALWLLSGLVLAGGAAWSLLARAGAEPRRAPTAPP